MTKRGLSPFRDGCPHEVPCWCVECKRQYAKNYQRSRWVECQCACGAPFQGDPGTARCPACRLQARPAVASCGHCGIECGGQRKYCSRRCIDAARAARMPRLQAETRACRWCLKDFATTMNAECCGSACRSALANQMATWRAPDRCAIPLCRRCCAPTLGGAATTYCPSCLVATKGKRALAERHGDRISLKALYERDGGLCHICGGRCRWNVTSLHEKYPTKDHLVPIAHDGPDTWDNVALAHRGCNIRRGTGGLAQLRLVG